MRDDSLSTEMAARRARPTARRDTAEATQKLFRRAVRILSLVKALKYHSSDKPSHLSSDLPWLKDAAAIAKRGM